MWDRDWIKDRLKTFPKFLVQWDYSLIGGSGSQLLLEPGYLYTLTAVVSVMPIFTKGRLERTLIDTWKYKIHSTSVSRVRTDYFHRREAQVTYSIEFGKPLYTILCGTTGSTWQCSSPG